ncbi:MAG: translation initiation factor IF-3 [Spirochaetes bacterium]|nr:translation initiation factor IF-3 [Spirochaetota bacterium]
MVIDKFDFKKYRINEMIKAREVRLVGEEDGSKIIPLDVALSIARERGLDLVEISPNQEPPVVKIIDYSKFRFEQIKKAKEAKKKQKVVHVKEIKFRPSIDTHDFLHKIQHAREFLENGDKVKFTIMFRGREIVHKDLGLDVMNRIRESLGDSVQIEKEVSQEGKNITMVVAPYSGSKKIKKVSEKIEEPRKEG